MKILPLVLLFVFATFSYAISVNESDNNGDGVTDVWVQVENGKTSSIQQDRNYDGEIDYTVHIDEFARKVLEEIDFNYDGHMDDFYHYKAGVLQSREIDTNYDQKIDLWVTITEGVYIEKIERDNDFDGEVDYVRSYGK